MIEQVRGRPGGRFYLTPLHRLVIVRGVGTDAGYFVAGQLTNPFAFRDADSKGEAEEVDATSLSAGDEYPGPLDKSNGIFKLAQKRGGVIERRLSQRTTEYAMLSDRTDQVLVENARSVLAAWPTIASTGITFYVNGQWHAWYMESGQAHFLGHVPGGFAWPNDGD